MNFFLKTLLFLLLISGGTTFAQDTTGKQTPRKFRIYIGFGEPKPDSLRIKRVEQLYKNEVSFNVFTYLLLKRLNLSYERFIENNHCVTLDITLDDEYDYERNKYLDVEGSNFSVRTGYVGYFSKKHFRGFYVNPYLAYRNNLTINSKDIPKNESKNYFASGLNLGYKLALNRISLKTQVGLLRNWYPELTGESLRFYQTNENQNKVYGLEVPVFIGFGFRF